MIALENEVSELREAKKLETKEEIAAKIADLEDLMSVGAVGENCDGSKCCNLDDRALQEFFDGSGI
jgi:hypothetical protein